MQMIVICVELERISKIKETTLDRHAATTEKQVKWGAQHAITGSVGAVQ